MKTANNDRLISLLFDDYLNLPEYVGFDAINVDTKSHFGDYPIHIASVRGSIDELKLLCENGANINAQGEWGYTALHNCIEFNYQDCAKYLLEMGANIDIVNIDGNKPLDIAKNLCSKEMIDLLLGF